MLPDRISRFTRSFVAKEVHSSAQNELAFCHTSEFYEGSPDTPRQHLYSQVGTMTLF